MPRIESLLQIAQVRSKFSGLQLSSSLSTQHPALSTVGNQHPALSTVDTQHPALSTFGSTFQKWLAHRAGSIGLSWPQGVADAAGVSAALLNSIGDTGNLRNIGRGARGYLARALQISVRELEALADGEIQWIDDGRIVAIDRLSPGIART